VQSSKQGICRAREQGSPHSRLQSRVLVTASKDLLCLKFRFVITRPITCRPKDYQLDRGSDVIAKRTGKQIGWTVNVFASAIYMCQREGRRRGNPSPMEALDNSLDLH